MSRLINRFSAKFDAPGQSILILCTLFAAFVVFEIQSLGLILSLIYFSAVLTVGLIVILLLKVLQFLK